MSEYGPATVVGISLEVQVFDVRRTVEGVFIGSCKFINGSEGPSLCPHVGRHDGHGCQAL